MSGQAPKQCTTTETKKCPYCGNDFNVRDYGRHEGTVTHVEWIFIILIEKAPIVPIFQNTPLLLSRSRPDDLSIQERKQLPNQETDKQPHQGSITSIIETLD